MTKINLAEKYRPLSLEEVMGNTKIKTEMKAWAQTWKRIAPSWKGFSSLDKNDELVRGERGFRPALVLAGLPGIGKTTCAHALAREMGWDVIELNASDARNRTRIRDVVTRGALNQVLSFDEDGSFKSYNDGNMTLIILDEADNLYDRSKDGGDDQVEDFSDRGGKDEIIKAIQLTRHPILLIVNDWYKLMGPRGGALHSCTRTIRFREPTKDMIKKVLVRILRNEGIRAQPAVIDIIAARAKGDVRGAINDLESLLIGRNEITMENISAFDRHRDKKKKIFDLMKTILLELDMNRAIKSLWEADESIGMVLEWVAENIPRVYNDKEELALGMEMISKADVFEGRILRHQYYRYRRYIGQLITGGVCIAKRRRHGWSKMQFPEHIKNMSRTKRKRRVERTLARKISRKLHVSTGYAISVFVPYWRIMAKSDNRLVFNTIYEMGLDSYESAALMDRDNVRWLWKQYLEYQKNRIRDSIGGGVKADADEATKLKKISSVMKDDEESPQLEVQRKIRKNHDPAVSLIPESPGSSEPVSIKIPDLSEPPTLEVADPAKPESGTREKKKDKKEKKDAQISLDSFF